MKKMVFMVLKNNYIRYFISDDVSKRIADDSNLKNHQKITQKRWKKLVQFCHIGTINSEYM